MFTLKIIPFEQLAILSNIMQLVAEELTFTAMVRTSLIEMKLRLMCPLMGAKTQYISRDRTPLKCLLRLLTWMCKHRQSMGV